MKYTPKPDKRNTSNGMIPNKAIRRAPAKKMVGKNMGRGK